MDLNILKNLCNECSYGLKRMTKLFPDLFDKNRHLNRTDYEGNIHEISSLIALIITLL